MARTGVLTTVRGPDGLDFLTSVEVLQFSGSDLRSLFFTGDFNGDGTAPTSRCRTAGATAFWMMDGTLIGAGSGNVGGTLGAGWFALGAGDFNDNASDDLLLQNGQQLAMWQMNGTADFRRQRQYRYRWGPAGWSPDIGNLNGDAFNDILLQNGQQLALWLMNGTDRSPAAAISARWALAGAWPAPATLTMTLSRHPAAERAAAGDLA